MTAVELSLFLRRGTMLKAVLPDIPAQQRHFLVVANANPRLDDRVYLVLITSKREASDRVIRRMNESPETLVVIPNIPSFRTDGDILRELQPGIRKDVRRTDRHVQPRAHHAMPGYAFGHYGHDRAWHPCIAADH